MLAVCAISEVWGKTGVYLRIVLVCFGVSIVCVHLFWGWFILISIFILRSWGNLLVYSGRSFRLAVLPCLGHHGPALRLLDGQALAASAECIQRTCGRSPPPRF